MIKHGNMMIKQARRMRHEISNGFHFVAQGPYALRNSARSRGTRGSGEDRHTSLVSVSQRPESSAAEEPLASRRTQPDLSSRFTALDAREQGKYYHKYHNHNQKKKKKTFKFGHVQHGLLGCASAFRSGGKREECACESLVRT